MGQRLFFALWPDKTTRDRLHALANATFKKPVPTPDFHMTLAFLGNCDSDKVHCVEATAQRLSAEPFQLSLDVSGSFHKAKIQWAGSMKAPEALLNLQRELMAGLGECGFPEKSANRYVPHVTLTRHVREFTSLEISQPIIWNVKDFVLVESLPARMPERGYYQVLHRWPLEGALIKSEQHR